MKFLKKLLRNGKLIKVYKSLLKGIHLTIAKIWKNKAQKVNPLILLLDIINYLGPFCNVKSITASGRTVFVPAPFRIEKRALTAVQFFVQGVLYLSQRRGYKLHLAIQEELFLLYEKNTNSEAFQKRKSFVNRIFGNEKNIRFLQSF